MILTFGLVLIISSPPGSGRCGLLWSAICSCCWASGQWHTIKVATWKKECWNAVTKTPQQQQLWLLHQKQGKLNLGSIFDKNLWCSLAVLTLAKEVWEVEFHLGAPSGCASRQGHRWITGLLWDIRLEYTHILMWKWNYLKLALLHTSTSLSFSSIFIITWRVD